MEPRNDSNGGGRMYNRSQNDPDPEQQLSQMGNRVKTIVVAVRAVAFASCFLFLWAWVGERASRAELGILDAVFRSQCCYCLCQDVHRPFVNL